MSEQPPSAPQQRPPRQQVELIVPLRTLLLVAAFLAVIGLALISLGSLLSIFVAGILALGLDPVVGALVRRGWKRGPAAVAVLAGLFVVVFLIVVITVGPLWDEVHDFLQEVPQYWEELTNSRAFETFVSSGAQNDVREALKDLAAGLPEAASTLMGIAGGVFGSVLSLVTLTFLALFLLMERPSITDWLFGFAPPPIEARWRPVVEESISAVSSSLIGNVAISFVAGTVAGVSAWAFGLPFPIVLAVITGFLDLIPQVGATVAAVILVAVALTVSPVAAVGMGVIQLIYQQLENYVVYPIVYRRAVELTAFTTIVAVLIASSILGVVGAILAVPFAAVVKIVIREAGRPRRERMAALRSPP
ncbi:AI-2E family transporter [Conexibacter stalactiti]|uniref:AI-2E family transporter n=1 Tax=Conexibacter stalactiti TaxID=1940611 RepID=A0ABU4HVA3_9ACTN|nr:AI-2E family transporter [Conexibacter stalactiti]MDW5597243.1 AI-2E family transporter [Conexibacter stalactiti]MEC5037885.1 AI-2E family transporter [Conexibacter stalactiti]